jgi:hypothetical protein
MFENRKSLQHHIFECLTIWREMDGLAKLVDRVLGSYRHKGQGYGKDNIEKEIKKISNNIKQCLQKVTDGHFTAVVKVLGPSRVVPYNEDTMKIWGINILTCHLPLCRLPCVMKLLLWLMFYSFQMH